MNIVCLDMEGVRGRRSGSLFAEERKGILSCGAPPVTRAGL